MRWFQVSLQKANKAALVAVRAATPDGARAEAVRIFGPHLKVSQGTYMNPQPEWFQVGGSLLAVEHSS